MLEYSQFRTPKKLRIATEGESRKKNIKNEESEGLSFSQTLERFWGLTMFGRPLSICYFHIDLSRAGPFYFSPLSPFFEAALRKTFKESCNINL